MLLDKVTEGKRQCLGRNDVFETTAYFAAGLLSDQNHATRLLESMKMFSSEIRDSKIAVRRKRSEHAKKRKQSEGHQLKRLQTKQAKLHLAGKDSKSCSWHKPDKMAPTNDCKAESEKETNSTGTKKRKAARKCNNCGRVGHCKTDCNEVIYEPQASRSKKPKISSDDVADLFIE